ncbi:MAG: WecB/TagA/CpsF family glycosyltransferase [Vicinamibacteria bacterium]|nr:WecB/TagA/CpsF family glycosyltransferase [Vicinamibacteria bacterium]
MSGYRFLRTRLEALDFAELTRRVADWLADAAGPARNVACLNTYCVTLAHDDPGLQAVYDRADLAGPDGMPFVFWMRRQLPGVRCERFYGPDVILHLAAEGVGRGWRFYLYGGAPGIAPRMAAELERRFPGLQVVGWHTPPFRPPTAEEDSAVMAELERLRPHVILVGLGTPKQDFWIDAHKPRLRGCVLVNVGAAFDFFAGRVRQAPRCVQRSGFEWLWRLLSRDFFRLFHRYTVVNARFLWLFARDRFGARTGGRTQ